MRIDLRRTKRGYVLINHRLLTGESPVLGVRLSSTGTDPPKDGERRRTDPSVSLLPLPPHQSLIRWAVQIR
jgi:hypothetical protein